MKVRFLVATSDSGQEPWVAFVIVLKFGGGASGLNVSSALSMGNDSSI